MSKWARAGHAGRFDGLPIAIDLQTLGVRGKGTIEVEENEISSRVKWFPIHPGHVYFTRQFGDKKEAVRLPKWFSVKADSYEESIGKRAVIDRQDFWKVEQNYDSYRPRIEFLRNEAAHDGYELNRESESDFKNFVLTNSDLRRGSLVLMDNGDIRAVWKDGQGSRLGLQFLGRGKVLYVIFKRRKTESEISRVAGHDTIDGILRRVNDFELGSLIYK